MWIPAVAAPVPVEEGAAPDQETRQSRRRKGATALEYLVVISFILCGCLMAINALGQQTGRIMNSNVNAIKGP